MAESVRLIAKGEAPCLPQPEEGASYDPIWKKKEVGQIPWAKMASAQQLHNFIRGNDKVPGAWTFIDGMEVNFIERGGVVLSGWNLVDVMHFVNEHIVHLIPSLSLLFVSERCIAKAKKLRICLGACSHLKESVSVRSSVCPSVHWFVGLSIVPKWNC